MLMGKYVFKEQEDEDNTPVKLMGLCKNSVSFTRDHSNRGSGYAVLLPMVMKEEKISIMDQRDISV